MHDFLCLMRFYNKYQHSIGNVSPGSIIQLYNLIIRLFPSIPNSSTMNHYRRPDQSRAYSYGNVNSNLIPWETDINRDAGHSAFEMMRGPTSPSNVREGIYNYTNPNSPNTIVDDPPPSRDTANHRRCGYIFRSWFPDLLCCILGILAIIGQTRAPLRILAS